MTATPDGIDLIDDDNKTCLSIASPTKEKSTPQFDLGINLPCTTIVNNVITLSVIIETQATCDDLRNILFIGRPPSVRDQLDFCDIINEKETLDKTMCHDIKCGPPADQCFFKFYTGFHESHINICEIVAS